MKANSRKAYPLMLALCATLATALAGTTALAQDKTAKPKTASSKSSVAVGDKVDSTGCNPATIATTDQLGSLLLFRKGIPVRQLANASAWITQCDAPLNIPPPPDRTMCRQGQQLLQGKSLRISKTNDGLEMTILEPDGKAARKGPAVLGGGDSAKPDGQSAAWLTMTWEVGTDKEEHYFVMLLDYTSTGLPKLNAVPKYYLVQAYNHEDWNKQDCKDESPANQANFEPYPSKSLNATFKVMQTDQGSGGEPGRPG